MMLSLLKRLQIIQILVMISVVSVLLLVFVILQFLSELHIQKADADYSKDAVLLTKLLDNIAHNHAVERGLTAGFLGSQGTKNKDKVAAQRHKADKTVDQWRSLKATDLNAFDMDYIQKTVEPLMAALAKKEKLREKVDALAPNNNAFAIYSEINEHALYAIKTIAVHIKDGEVLHHLDDLVNMLWVKERAGQIRGKLNGVFASGKVTEPTFYQIVEYIHLENKRLKSFYTFSDEEEKAIANEYRGQPHWSRVERITTEFLQGATSGAVKDPTNGQWFTLATARIKDIKKITVQLEERLVQEAQDKINQINQRIMLVIITSLAVILLILGFNIFIYKRLKKHVFTMKQGLMKVTDEHDLTLRLNKTGNDEFVHIGRSIDRHLSNMNTIFRAFNESSENVLYAANTIKTCLDDSKSSAHSQNDQADQMAVAVSQLSNSAQDIAERITAINDNMLKAAQHSTTSLQQSEVVRNIFSQLTQDADINQQHIESLAEQSQGISSIIDTISGIAEQTNLLALNAAIEAARAGEQGRGFAVVADEVRSLAQKTQDSTASIRDMIERLEESSKIALDSMNTNRGHISETADRIEKSDQSVSKSHNEIKNIHQTIQQVTETTDEQAAVLNDINKQIEGLKKNTEDTFSSIKNADDRALSLSKEISELNTHLGTFKV